MQPARVNGPGTGIFDGRRGEFAEPAVFGDGAQAARRGQRRRRIDSGRAGRAPAHPIGGPRERLEPVEILVEAQVEIDALHLAVGDPVEARAELVVDRQADGVADGLLAIGRAESVRLGLHVGR